MEYLFRGKRTNGLGWCYGSLIKYSNEHFAIYENETFCNVIPETVGMWSGLVDKNETRIFEGDILINDLGHVSGFSPKPQVVEFKIYLNTTAISAFSPFYATKYFPSKSIIIGNVFDNIDIIKDLDREYSCGFDYKGMTFDKICSIHDGKE